MIIIRWTLQICGPVIYLHLIETFRLSSDADLFMSGN